MPSHKLVFRRKIIGLFDLLAFKHLVPNRKKAIATQAAEPCKEPLVNGLARQLHPTGQQLLITKVTEETPSTKTFRLEPDIAGGTVALAPFRAGQYLSIRVPIGGISVRRPYTIASSPVDARNGFYEITVKRSKGGLVSDYILNNWRPGTSIACSGPEGHFYYDELRDTLQVVGIAGGCGITPFRAMVKDFLENQISGSFMLLYGSTCTEEIIYHDELGQLAAQSQGRFQVIHVISEKGPVIAGRETGYISADIIKKYVNIEQSTFFICGPPAMVDYMEPELRKARIAEGKIRWEASGDLKNILQLEEYASVNPDAIFRIRVTMGGETRIIAARAVETILVALEKAGLSPPNRCRSGECGFCRSFLASGNVFTPTIYDKRRAADGLYGYIHPCISYPLSDLEISTPRDI